MRRAKNVILPALAVAFLLGRALWDQPKAQPAPAAQATCVCAEFGTSNRGALAFESAAVRKRHPVRTAVFCSEPAQPAPSRRL